MDSLDDRDQARAPVPHASSRWLANTLQFAVKEAVAARPGTAAMLTRITELIFLEIVREYVQQLAPRERGWLAALEDPQVGTAIRLLHRDPARHWTVELLAHDVAASRSGLAERFSRLVGAPPMKYLFDRRMQMARQLLRNRRQSVRAVAERVGYHSEPAFSRAFKKAIGCPPAAWRKAAAHPSPSR